MEGRQVQAAEPKRYTITNRFMFGRIFSNPDNVRPLLEAVLGVPVGEIHYAGAEHAVEPSLFGKGVRMDVFVDDGQGTVYDVEMQNVGEGDLALRSRYLLSSFDRDRIARGEDYESLGRSVVIFVCAFDPLGLGERLYVVRPMVEGLGVAFEDGTMRAFLNARGAADAENAADADGLGALAPARAERLAAFLSFVDGGGTMGDEWVERLEGEVDSLNADLGWRDTMYTYDTILRDEIRIGIREGIKEELKKAKEELQRQAQEEIQKQAQEDLRKAKEEETELNRRLVAALREAGRIDELADAIVDDGVRERLIREFGLASHRKDQHES